MKNSKEFIKKAARIALAAAVFLAVPAGALYPKHRGRGAELVVQKKDGTFIKGELLFVRERTLILLDKMSGTDVTVGIDDVDAFKVVRSPRFSARFSWAALLVGVPASVYGLTARNGAFWTRMGIGIGGGTIALLGMASLIKGTDEVAVLKGGSEQRTSFALNKLVGMAFFRGSLPADFDAVRKSLTPRAPSAGKESVFRDLTVSRPTRLHLSFEPFYPLSERTGPYVGLFRAMGFGDTRPGGGWWIFTREPTAYPRMDRISPFSLRGARIEYSLTRSLAVGFAYASLGSGSTDGFRLIPVPGMPWSWWTPADYSPLYISEDHKSDGFFLSAAWMPPPDTFFNSLALKFGVELGACISRLDFATSEGSYEAVIASRSLRKTVPAAGVFGELSYYFGRNASLGFRAGYRYARTRIGAFNLDGTFLDLDDRGSLIHSPLTIAFPAHRLDLGGPALGVTLGLHF